MPMSLSETTKPWFSKSKPCGAGMWATSCRSARVVILMSLSADASLFIFDECGPATLTTMGVLNCDPLRSVIACIRPLFIRIEVTSELNLKAAPFASAAR